jgi:hypothetical protein
MRPKKAKRAARGEPGLRLASAAGRELEPLAKPVRKRTLDEALKTCAEALLAAAGIHEWACVRDVERVAAGGDLRVTCRITCLVKNEDRSGRAR